jgi:hypothetical protein
LAYFYIHPAERASFKKILGAILRQISEQLSVIPSSIDKSFESRGSLHPNNDELVAAFVEVTRPLPEVVVIIDGLDMLEYQDEIDLLKFLFKSQHRKLKWIVLSRRLPEPDYVMGGTIHYNIKTSDIEADIQAYAHERLSQHRHLIKRPELRESLVATVTEKASGS